MTSATALGSWPGTDSADVREAVRIVRDVLTDAGVTGRPGLPYLPEVPGRGPGADMIGRTAGMLVGLPVDLQPSGWRFVDRPGRDVERARSFLRADLDELAEAYDGYAGRLKLQATGPWTLAAELRLGRGERSIVDRGAARDLADSLTEGLRAHVAEVARIVPGAEIVLQLDEPELPAAIAGSFATSSGFGRLRAIDPEDARRALADVVAGVRAAGVVEVAVHCCAPDVPIGLLREAGVDALALDVALLGPRGWESVAVAVEAGVALWAGALPTSAPSTPPDTVAAPVVRAWRELGLDPKLLDDVLVTPACGLAGVSPVEAVTAHKALPRAAAELAEAAAR